MLELGKIGPVKASVLVMLNRAFHKINNCKKGEYNQIAWHCGSAHCFIGWLFIMDMEENLIPKLNKKAPKLFRNVKSVAFEKLTTLIFDSFEIDTVIYSPSFYNAYCFYRLGLTPMETLSLADSENTIEDIGRVIDKLKKAQRMIDADAGWIDSNVYDNDNVPTHIVVDNEYVYRFMEIYLANLLGDNIQL